MRRNSIPFWFMLACARILGAQTTVPVSGEPRHHFKFENAYIRLYDVIVPPGDTTYFHVHAVDYTYVSIGAANLVAQVLGSDPAPLVLREDEVRFTKGPITHRVWNVGVTPFHNITIELLHHGSAESALPDLSPGDSVVLENARVRVVRRVILPDATMTSTPQHALEVYLSPGRVDVNDGRAARALDVKPGTYLWSDSAAPRLVRNVGTERLVMLTFWPK